MPLLIGPGEGDAIDLDDLAEALDASPFDVRDEADFARFGPLLARLGRNRTFLADLAIEELKARCTEQTMTNGYGPQVFLLRQPKARYLLRANFWPAAHDPVLRASGAPAFFYGMPHDHNFSFLTCGYFGPGYWSDYYEYDGGPRTGLPGEPSRLHFIERARLDPGKLMLYRRRTDVHAQLPPDAFSVSLNILAADPAQPWCDQYRFDVESGRIAEVLTVTAAEALVTLAVHAANGLDLATSLARDHPCARMRITAIEALAAVAPDGAARHGLWCEAAASPSARVAGHARLRLRALDAGQLAP